jgi:multiple sugar transport system ATP-binding protein
MTGKVYAVELTGESNLVTVLLGKERVIARAPRSWRGKAGETIGLKADRGRLHLFDKESGQRVDNPRTADQ